MIVSRTNNYRPVQLYVQLSVRPSGCPAVKKKQTIEDIVRLSETKKMSEANIDMNFSAKPEADIHPNVT